MHGSIVIISSSLSSVFKQFINASYLSCQLIAEVVSFRVLEDEFGIEELFIDETRS
jgi:hypothetical protein